MLLNDKQIKELGEEMISPFNPSLVSITDTHKVISYGTSSYGYDIRLSPKEFLIFKHIPGTIVNPKSFNPANLEPVPLQTDEYGDYFIIPANSYGLGVSLEEVRMPSDITAICIGKSTYARVGLIVNVTPIEACLSSDTEVLTDRGWEKIGDIKKGRDRVLTLNPDTNNIEYHKIEEVYSYEYDGDLFNIKSYNSDQLVTPKHKLYVLDKETNERGRVTAKEVINNKDRYQVYSGINWQGMPPSNKLIKTVNKTYKLEEWLELIGCLLTYGTTGSGKSIKLINGKKTRNTTNKGTKTLYRINLLNRVGLTYKNINGGIEINSRLAYEYLAQYGKGKTDIKVPKGLKSLEKRYLHHFLLGVFNVNKLEEGCTVSLYSLKYVKDIEEMLIKLDCLYTIEKLYNVYKITFMGINPYREFEDITDITKVSYVGKVYDLTVPNHIFLCRRNGVRTWTGNSWGGHITLEFSNAAQTDCRIYANEGICQLLFLKGEACEVDYQKRGGKYHNQPHAVTLPRMLNPS